MGKILTLRKLKRKQKKMDFKETAWEIQKDIKTRENKIEAEKQELQVERKKIKLPSWSKLLLMFLFINFTILEIFIGWVTAMSFILANNLGMSPDFSPLITLIGAVIGETISYGIYCAKSKAENTKNGIVYQSMVNDFIKENNVDPTNDENIYG